MEDSDIIPVSLGAESFSDTRGDIESVEFASLLRQETSDQISSIYNNKPSKNQTIIKKTNKKTKAKK